jgi:hypothetical protein
MELKEYIEGISILDCEINHLSLGNKNIEQILFTVEYNFAHPNLKKIHSLEIIMRERLREGNGRIIHSINFSPPSSTKGVLPIKEYNLFSFNDRSRFQEEIKHFDVFILLNFDMNSYKNVIMEFSLGNNPRALFDMKDNENLKRKYK